MSLPKWIEELKQIVEVTDTLNPQEGKMAIEALTIAVEALEKIYEGDPEGVYAGPEAKEALRRIEELGK